MTACVWWYLTLLRGRRELLSCLCCKRLRRDSRTSRGRLVAVCRSQASLVLLPGSSSPQRTSVRIGLTLFNAVMPRLVLSFLCPRVSRVTLFVRLANTTRGGGILDENSKNCGQFKVEETATTFLNHFMHLDKKRRRRVSLSSFSSLLSRNLKLEIIHKNTTFFFDTDRTKENTHTCCSKHV